MPTPVTKPHSAAQIVLCDLPLGPVKVAGNARQIDFCPRSGPHLHLGCARHGFARRASRPGRELGSKNPEYLLFESARVSLNLYPKLSAQPYGESADASAKIIHAKLPESAEGPCVPNTCPH